MNASIDLLLDKAGLADAQVLDFREGAREVFDIRCVQMLDAEGVASLSTDVLYVADNAALTYLAGCLDGMSVAFAGDMPAAKAFAPVEKCRVFCVPEFASAGDLLNTLVAAQRAVDGFDERLMWASVGESPLETMLQVMADELHEAIVATDVDDVLVAFAAPDGMKVSDPAIRRIVDNGCVISDAMLDDSLLAQVIDEAAYDDMALIEMPDEGRKYLTVMVRRGEEHVCQLLMGDEGGAFTPCTQDLLLRFRLVLERIAQQGLRLGGLPSPENNSCVRRLLDHIYVREEVLDGYLRKRGWHFEDEYYCIMVQTSGKDAQMVRQMLLRQIRSGALHGSVVLSYEDEIACVVNGAVLPYDRAFLLESLGSIAKRFPARFGVSNVFHDFRETKRYYDTCRLALAYGELEEPERAVCLFEDYAPRHLEKVLFSRSVNEALLDAHAYEIQRYDNEHGGEFLRTLLVYLECGQNKTLAAQELFIHRNTLVYRIGVIEKMAGVDLGALGADQLFHLMYTCRYLLSRK